MPAPTDLRPRTDGDLEACAEVLAEVHRADGYPVHWPDRPGEWVARAASIGAWVAELDGRVVGHVGLSEPDPDDRAAGMWGRPSAVVGRLFVSPAARGFGVGARLMDQAVTAARAVGRHPVLHVVATRTDATAFYERLGWTLMGTVEETWNPGETVTIHCYAAPS
ncbi:GNAT family N-acetyltransferase [Nonomuraea longicatena]|uniref:GNAT family N-acetyltransferase n=1 Tax=Nonomuraea longicatena TaxID=83682 RepID=A0ABN1RB29_9ACTN